MKNSKWNQPKCTQQFLPLAPPGNQTECSSSLSEMGLEVLKTEVVKPIHYFTVLFAGYNSKGNPQATQFLYQVFQLKCVPSKSYNSSNSKSFVLYMCGLKIIKKRLMTHVLEVVFRLLSRARQSSGKASKFAFLSAIPLGKKTEDNYQ